HAISVPSGSYVLPAAHVSAMGQGNTINGMAILTRMFGQPAQMRRGPGPPRTPAPKNMNPVPSGIASAGGARGEHVGRDFPIRAVVGELVISRDRVARVGGGDIDHGHAILDHWVKTTHKKYAKPVANLPPPAKS